MRCFLLVAFVLSLPLGLVAAGPQGAPQDDDAEEAEFQKRVDEAIRRGISYLKGKSIGSHHKIPSGNELILLTYLHAGVPDDDAHFKSLLEEGLEAKLEWTYKVALHAMCLEEYQRVHYQWRIHQCAQFLADNISSNGTTRYGQPTEYVDDIEPEPIPTTNPRKDEATSGGIFKRPETEAKKKDELSDVYAGTRKKPKVVRAITVKQRRKGPADNDHSNMQYAALGLRACHDAGIRFEPGLLRSVDQWWRSAQEKDQNAKEEPLVVDMPAPPKKEQPARLLDISGGGTRSAPRNTSTRSERRPVNYVARPEGWRYQKGHKEVPRGSMTAGAVGALCILDYMQNKDWRRDKDVLEGLQWLAKHFTVEENPGLGSKWHYYYLYGIERAGMLFGTERFNDHRWYRTGAEYLLQHQGGGGGWHDAVDTCFAILFLKRATRKLKEERKDVATGGYK